MSRPFAVDRIVMGAGAAAASIESGAANPSDAPGLARPKGSLWLQTTGALWVKELDAQTGWKRIAVPILEAVNADVVTLLRGMPVYLSGATVLRAAATGVAAAGVVGLVIGEAAPTLSTFYIAAGSLELPTATWDLVTGQVGGLTAGAHYYVGLLGGSLTTVPPSQAGQLVAVAGRALTTTRFLVSIQPPILL